MPRVEMARIPEVVTLNNVSGAVTLDLDDGLLFVLNLTGNVTSFAFSNPPAEGREVEVHFVQDGNGDRTLAGVNASIRLAAGDLVLSTIGGRRDVLRFRRIGSVYWETSRSLYLQGS
jgi:hypothetical protein